MGKLQQLEFWSKIRPEVKSNFRNLVNDENSNMFLRNVLNSKIKFDVKDQIFDDILAFMHDFGISDFIKGTTTAPILIEIIILSSEDEFRILWKTIKQPLLELLDKNCYEVFHSFELT